MGNTTFWHRSKCMDLKLAHLSLNGVDSPYSLTICGSLSPSFFHLKIEKDKSTLPISHNNMP